MSRIDQTFAALRSRREKALVAYVMAGDPDYETSLRVVEAVAEGGADLIELGIPFSDPLADGATIQRACLRALAGGMTLRQAFDMVAEVRARTSVPTVFMTYYNPVFQFGEEAFARRAAEVGLDGVIVPDLPPEEAEGLRLAMRGRDLDQIFLVAPTTGEVRLRRIAEKASGFLYYVSLLGVTGTRDKLAEGVEGAVLRIREFSDRPVVVGFGISSKVQVRQVGQWADGAVIGSALVQIVESTPRAELPYRLTQFVRTLKSGTRLPPSDDRG